MNHLRRAATVLPALGAGGAAAITLLHRRDAQVLAADREHAALTAPLAGRPLAVVSADGTVLHAELHGPDHGPSVVLVHGWMCTSATWQLQLRALAEHHRVVTFDQRGHGRSAPAASGDYSSAALAADLDAVLDQAVPHHEQAVVVGHSMGAMAVVAWAESHPDQVRHRLAGVVLVNAGVENLVGRSTLIPFPAALAAWRGAIGERVLAAPLRLPTRTNPVASRVVRAVALGRSASPAQVAFCTEMLLATPTDVRAAFGATLSTFDLAHGLPALSVPTVVIAGECDHLTPPVHARAIAEVLPDATLVELPGVGHMAPVEAGDAVTSEVLTLLHHAGRSSPA